MKFDGKKAVKRVLAGGLYSAFRAEFLAAAPCDLTKLGFIAAKKLRPYAARLAKQHGIDYLSVSLAGKPELARFVVLQQANSVKNDKKSVSK